MNNRNWPYSISTINPKTGESDDLIATARAAVTHLHTLCKEDVFGRCFGRFSIQKQLEDAGFKKCVPHLVLFLNFMGLVRKLSKEGGEKGGLSYRYMVIDPTFFDLLVTEDSVCCVLKQMKERAELQKLCRILQKQLDDLGGNVETSSMSDDDISGMNKKLAEVIAEVERLNGIIAEKDALISSLKASQVSPRAVSDELMARFRQMKSS